MALGATGDTAATCKESAWPGAGGSKSNAAPNNVAKDESFFRDFIKLPHILRSALPLFASEVSVSSDALPCDPHKQ
jgi:hypothetical protein